MYRTLVWTLALLGAAACSSATSPVDPSDPLSTTKPAAPVNIAGEWVDTSYVNAWADIWHITQSGQALTVIDSLYDGTAAQGWTFKSATIIVATIAGDSANLPVSCSADCVGQTIAYARDGQIALYNLPTGCGANDSAGSPCDTAGSANIYTRGTWAPPAPPSVIALNGVYMSDSLPWTALGEPCLGTIQIDLVIDKAGPGYPNAPAGGYMSTEYDRQCGSNWQDAIASWVVIDSGRVSSGVLSLAENELPSGYTGPFTTAGNNWQFQVVSNDSLADITPSSINLGWRPPAFVYQPAGFYADARTLRALRSRLSRRR